MIQSWRSTKFNDGDPDSTLILAFTPEGNKRKNETSFISTCRPMTIEGVVEGWETHYWRPWRRYLAG